MELEAKIIAHSKSSITGKEIVTWELQYPRIIHGEFMTHRLFSRNAASSRAIPVAKILEMVRTSPAMPVRFGANQAGMQDKGVDHTALVLMDYECGQAEFTPQEAWAEAADSAVQWAKAFADAGYHKQVVNRLLEPFQWMKTVMTATELDNWFWLRDHVDADPTIHALAHLMWEELQKSEPVTLKAGDWHMPYYGSGVWRDSGYCNADMEATYNKRDSTSTLSNALAISASCCAQVSYRKLDDGLGKAKDIFAKLIESKPCHASPTEHQATPMNYPYADDTTELSNMDGATHIDRNGCVWSGNFKGWIQHRQLLDDNACWNYTPKTKENV